MKQLFRITEMRVCYIEADNEEEAFEIFDELNEDVSTEIESCNYERENPLFSDYEIYSRSPTGHIECSLDLDED